MVKYPLSVGRYSVISIYYYGAGSNEQKRGNRWVIFCLLRTMYLKEFFGTGNVATCLVFVGELQFIYKLNDAQECKVKLL